MKEANIRGEIFNLLERLWFWPISMPNMAACGNFLKPGRPDIICLHPTRPSVAVECKRFTDGRFAFDKIEPVQRAWLSMWEEDQGQGFLGLGTVTGRAGALNGPRRIWLIPWKKWVGFEASVTDRKSATVEMVTGSFADWELIFRDGVWHAKDIHPLATPERNLGEWRAVWLKTKEAYGTGNNGNNTSGSGATSSAGETAG